MATSLQQFLEEDNERGGVFSTIMAPFPIFLAMLCHVWKNESTRKKAMKLQTVSQLTNLMVYVLKEHFALKIDKSGQGELYVECIRNASASFAEVGNVAYPHDPTVVTRPLVFDEEDSQSNREAFETVCKVGLLTRDKTVAPMHLRQTWRQAIYNGIPNSSPVDSRLFSRHLPWFITHFRCDRIYDKTKRTHRGNHSQYW